MKMMHRALAAADREALGGRDRGTDVSSLPHAPPARASRPLASPAAIADESVQPVPWLLRVAMRGAASRVHAARVDQKIDALRPLAVTALDQHGARAERQQTLGLRAHLGFAVRAAACRSGPRLPADWA